MSEKFKFARQPELAGLGDQFDHVESPGGFRMAALPAYPGLDAVVEPIRRQMPEPDINLRPVVDSLKLAGDPFAGLGAPASPAPSSGGDSFKFAKAAPVQRGILDDPEPQPQSKAVGFEDDEYGTFRKSVLKYRAGDRVRLKSFANKRELVTIDSIEPSGTAGKVLIKASFVDGHGSIHGVFGLSQIQAA